MATDYWPQEENAIWRTLIVPMYPDDTITEVSAVKMGTTVAGRLSCAAWAQLGDGIGVALKYATVGAPERIPVMLHGIVKLVSGASTTHTVTAGIGVMANAAQTVLCTHNVGTYGTANNAMFTGSSHTLGMALHTQVLTGDEILVHVGHSL